MNDVNGRPGDTQYAQGNLTTSIVTSTYSWVDIAFYENPLLNVGTTYWLKIGGSGNISNSNTQQIFQ